MLSAAKRLTEPRRARCFASLTMTFFSLSFLTFVPYVANDNLPHLEPSTKPSRHVRLGLFQMRVHEDGIGRAVFHQPSQIHTRRVVAHAGGLLHVMGDNDDRIL